MYCIGISIYFSLNVYCYPFTVLVCHGMTVYRQIKGLHYYGWLFSPYVFFAILVLYFICLVFWCFNF
ncbi:MAG: hypothetical protein LBH00_02200 [Planctomycetaceae bacterium]|nr:hypothetical protein [Planctomycetaceae bacterium]